MSELARLKKENRQLKKLLKSALALLKQSKELLTTVQDPVKRRRAAKKK